MHFDFNFHSSILLIFFIHGAVYAILLWIKGVKSENSSNKWLSIFLLLCILYIAPWMLGFAGWYDAKEGAYRDLLFYIPFQHLFFIGPVIFFYVQSLLNPGFTFTKKQAIHLLPGILYLLFSIIVVVTDKIVLKEYYFLANGQDPDFDTWYQVAGFFSMLLYFLGAIRFYTLYKKLMVQVVSYADKILFSWVRNFLVAFSLMLIIKMVFFTISQFVELFYWDSWWYYLVFAILFYYIAISGYNNSIETKVGFVPNFFSDKQTLLLENPFTASQMEATEDAEIIDITPGENRVNDALIEEWKLTLANYMEVDKAYQDPELSLTQVAKQLQSNPSLISKMVNQGFQQNFNDFVNSYRIHAVKAMIEKGEHKKQTLLGIAYDAGFNSKATFNRAFKKLMGMSPKTFIEQQEN